MNKNKLILIVTITLLAIGGFVAVKLVGEEKIHTGDIEIVHDLGTASVMKNPEKVVVFDLGILETLDALDVKVVSVPKSSLPAHLSKYKAEDFVEAGTLLEPNFEVLFELAPDLIIISSRQSEVYEELDNIAPTIYMQINNTDFVNGFKKNLETLSSIFTKVKDLDDYVERIEQKVVTLKNVASSSNLKGLFIMVNSNKISLFGEGSRFDVLYSDFGVEAAVKNVEDSTHGQTNTFEFLLEVNPDIIFVLDRGVITEGQGTAEELLNNEIINKTNAAINDRIIYLTPNSWYTTTGGITSIEVMISEVETAFTK